MNGAAGELAGLTQEEADAAHPRLARGARPARAPRALPALGRRSASAARARIEPLISLAVVVRDGGAEAAGARGAARPGASASTPTRSTGSRSTRSRTRPTGASRASSGGATSIPLWYCPAGARTVAETEPERCAECGSTGARPQEDVLDTWFSSALWPFATLGWPDDTPELASLLPGRPSTSTAREIISPLGEPDDLRRARAARRAARSTTSSSTRPCSRTDGRRMSKSLGTGIDPLELIDDARRRRDALRPAEDVVDARTSASRTARSRRGGSSRTSSGTCRGCSSPTPAGPRVRASGRRRSRSGGSSRGSTRRRRRSRSARALRLRGGRGRALPPDLRRLLRLVRRGDQAAPLRRGRRRAATALTRSSACSSCCTRSCRT